jgi:hypothetical protein
MLVQTISLLQVRVYCQDKFHFKDLCTSYGLKRKPTNINNPKANAILERVHQVLMAMIQTSELDMADSVAPSDIDAVLTKPSWAIRETDHTNSNKKTLQEQHYLDETWCSTFPP